MIDLASLRAPAVVLMAGWHQPADGSGGATEALVTRVELEPATGATIKLGDSQAVRKVLVWRHGLVGDPASPSDIRNEVGRWFTEDGKQKRHSIALWALLSYVTIDGVAVIGLHIGILATEGRFRIRHCLIDAAGAGIEAFGSKDTSLIENVQVHGQWSSLHLLGRDVIDVRLVSLSEPVHSRRCT